MSKAWDDRWHRYDLALKAAGVPGKLRGPAQAWVESFLKRLRPRKWWAAEWADARAFLDDLSRKGRPIWQREEASESLRIFFQEVEPCPWASHWIKEIPQVASVPSHLTLSPLRQMEIALQARGLSDRTRVAYLAWVRRYLGFSAGSVSPEQMNLFLQDLARQSLSGSTLIQAFNALKVFHLSTPGQVWNLPRPLGKTATRSSALPSSEEITLLLAALPSAPHRFLVRLLSETGISLAKAALLRVRDVRLADRRLGPESPLFPSSLSEDLSNHFAALRTLWEEDRSRGLAPVGGNSSWEDYWLFPSPRVSTGAGSLSRPALHPQSFQQLLRRAGHRAGLGQITPQTLRRFFARRFLEAGAGLPELQKALGHADLSSTLRYRLR